MNKPTNIGISEEMSMGSVINSRRGCRAAILWITLVLVVITGCGRYGGPDAPGDPGIGGPEAPGAPPTTEPAPKDSSVPDELVGRWVGGSNDQGHWYYEFQSDGSYAAWPAYKDNPTVMTGTMEVTSTQITFSNGGSPFTVEWSIDGGILFMDEYSYVPA